MSSLGFSSRRSGSLISHYWTASRIGRKSVHTCQAMLNSQKNEQDSASSSSSESEATSTAVSETTEISGKGGFIKAMAKFEGHESFTKMLRNSQFVQIGDPEGKVVEGTIFQIVDDDLYIDFGFKFHCVCTRPPKNGGAYTLGKKVRVKIQDLELSTRFLGAKTDLTILEADCILLGLAEKSPTATTTTTTSNDPLPDKKLSVAEVLAA